MGCCEKGKILDLPREKARIGAAEHGGDGQRRVHAAAPRTGANSPVSEMQTSIRAFEY